MEKDSRIYVAGHGGLVGSAVMAALKEQGYSDVIGRSRAELNLLNQAAVHRFFEEQQIDYCIVAAAKVGGILYNLSNQADFLYENLVIETNVIHAAAEHGVKKLLLLGSSCIYPKMAPQPIKEDYLMTGPLEPTNEGYAIAKIAGLKLCEKYWEQYGKRFTSVMPTNLYGPGDNFHPDHSHVIPGMMRRFHEAKLSGKPDVTIWGTGSPRREFLFIEDLAEAIIVLMDKYEEPTTINVGTGIDCSILDLAELMKKTVGFEGEIKTDPSKPDGTPRKVLDVSRIKALGWKPNHSLEQGLKRTYEWALKNGSLD
ncbi:MAG: GDP-L-fucose synthase [Bdellovibrionales bacterium]|nr:GDP-L-fucose synthase [Bdellovibrionales bacterium]